LRPLTYAARNGFRNLAVVRDLESSLKAAVDALGHRLADDRRDEIVRLVDGLDGTPLPERQRRAERLLQLLAPALPDGSAEASEAGPAAEASEAGPAAEAPSGPRSSRPPSRKLAAAAPAPSQAPTTGRRIPMHRAEPGSSLSAVVGIGPKTAERLAKKGLHVVQDLLFFLPRGYEDRGQVKRIAELEAGERAVVEGEVLLAQPRYAGRGRRIFEAVITDGTGRLTLRFFRFRQRSMEGRFAPGRRVRASGPVTRFGSTRQMVHPELDDPEAVAPEGVLPVYPDVEGVPARTLRGIIQRVAAVCAERVVDPMPRPILEAHDLPDLATAVAQAHAPAEGAGAEVERMRDRLVFDELLLFQLALAIQRTRRDDEPGLVHPAAAEWSSLAERLFPFALTGAQRRASAEIADDLAAPRPMNRLLLGDVGSGKTAVAMLSAAVVQRGRRQVAILAPTEVLAEQHARSARRDLEPNGLRVALLTGSTTQKSRAALLRWMKTGHVDVVIGTHALLEPDVQFRDLGLVVIDEQHRFGVQQRGRLREKSRDLAPDVLVMTATPIPRTLALTAYGDLRVSVIDELPPGRTPVTTRVCVGGAVRDAYRAIEDELAGGRQAYVVYPLVDASEKLDLKAATEAADELRSRFAPYEVGVLHGRLKSDEKVDVMQRFSRNEIQVLVSTTVIEVGVDVPNATVMVVEEADRFGLSQLHQLRGRVGRGHQPGSCWLVTGRDEATERLRVLEDTSNGFEVAERDLQLRGPGEILGTRQSGLPDLVLADLVRDAAVVDRARQEAFRIVQQDPRLTVPDHQGLRQELLRRFHHRLTLAEVG
jgi:ATP-dependent DNA helicase RecG